MARILPDEATLDAPEAALEAIDAAPADILEAMLEAMLAATLDAPLEPLAATLAEAPDPEAPPALSGQVACIGSCTPTVLQSWSAVWMVSARRYRQANCREQMYLWISYFAHLLANKLSRRSRRCLK